jgi:hypothetical protein
MKIWIKRHVAAAMHNNIPLLLSFTQILVFSYVHGILSDPICAKDQHLTTTL